MPVRSSTLEATTEFLRRYAPFSRMSDAALAFLVPRLLHAHFAKDATILATHTGPVAHLHIVQRGLVGSRPNNAQADPDRTLGPGELFPVGALSAGGTTTKVFSALKDTHCYLLARADFLELRQASPEFERYCTQAITETLKQSLESLYGQYSQRAAEQQLLTRTLAELVRHRPDCLSGDGHAARSGAEDGRRQECARSSRSIATRRRSGCSPSSTCCVRVVLPGRLLDAPLADVMTAPLVTLPASATASEAMHVMAERGIRQIVVVDNGRLCGVINERDLFALQRVSLRQVNEELHDAEYDRLRCNARARTSAG